MDLPIQLVIFDLMGTLIVDDGIVARAYDAALAEGGLQNGSPEYEEARSRVDALQGRPTGTVLSDALGDPVRAEEASWAFDDSILEAIPGLKPVPGAGDTLAEVARRGAALAVTTSFTAEVRKVVLDQMGWSDRFGAVLSAHGDRRGHPAPDLLLEAILALGIDSVAQVAMVGDSVADLEAGNRAGAGLVIGVLSGTHDRATLQTAPHTHLVASVVDVLQLLDAPRTSGQRRAGDSP